MEQQPPTGDQPARRLTPIHGEPRDASTPAPVLDRLTQPDLATKIADLVDTVVDVVRNRVVNPVERAAIYIVLGLFSLFAGLTLVVLLLVGLFRLLVGLLNLLPGAPYVWLAYLIMGGIFLGLGVFTMRKRAKIVVDESDAPEKQSS